MSRWLILFTTLAISVFAWKTIAQMQRYSLPVAHIGRPMGS